MDSPPRHADRTWAPILATLGALALLLWLGRSGVLDSLLIPPSGAEGATGMLGAGPLWVVFLTGLTVGGLSCMAVQGGLLLASVASISAARRPNDARHTRASMPTAAPPADWRIMAAPAAQFLSGKLIAYTLLGALLGAAGARFPLRLQGWLLLLAALFMVAMALQTLGPGPGILRGMLARLVPSPPKRLQRYIRARSRRGDARGPAVLGALTIFLPCGVTLAMESLAIASGSALTGAAILAVFTLGTAPLFLGLGLVVGQLGGATGRAFRPAAALLITAIAVFTFSSGTRLLGWDWSWDPRSAISNNSGANPSAPDAVGEIQTLSIQALSAAYEPAHARLKSGRPIRLAFTGSVKPSCTNAVVLPRQGIEAQLKGGEVTYIDLPAQAPGKLSFICGMGMYGGEIEIQP